MKISFIGSGNVAWHLAQELEDKGHFICEVYSRDITNAKLLVKKLFDSKAVNSLDFSNSEAEIFILAVKDDAILKVLDHLELPDKAILVHTSGTKSIELIDNWIEDSPEQKITSGIFYPLMTFSKSRKLNFQNVPFCIEAHDHVTEQKLVKLAQEISKIVYLVDGEERKILHLAAVFANNFVNHLLSISQDLLEANQLEMNLLRPLIIETIEKAMAVDDINIVQTGPAMRGDQKTIKSHLAQLKNMPQQEKIYRVISESIYNNFNKEEE
jgi:predicted short-subunit dehydrogenase-like oxidoreductase (DUF2520 family)